MFTWFFFMLVIDLLMLVGSTSAQTPREKTVEQKCTTMKTCGECIGLHYLCSWCKQEVFQRQFHRCDFKEILRKRNCSLENIISPKSSKKILKDNQLSEADIKTDSYVQLKPQEIKLRIRPKEVITFPVEFRQAEDYPLDLYYLMDLTYSMRDDKEKLEELGENLAGAMSKLTRNFRIGFGSFVDKVLLPYVNTVPSKLQNPCLDGKVCVPPYGFRNHMPLSNNKSRFISYVSKASVSGNLDDAEGGFDAIMQVIACKSEIDWNERSRKIILFATDSGFHYAGDGKLGGAVIPNDESCHLDNKGYYSMSKYQDYPSLSQISRKIKENKIIMIFAVTSRQLSVYTKLSNAIEGAYVQELASDSSNIVDLVRHQYKEIRSEVEMKYEHVPENIKITTTAECPKGEKGQNICRGLKIGSTVSFNISIELESCPKNGAHRHSHKMLIYPAGLDEVLKVQLEMLCQCDCEQESEKVPDSPICNSHGTYECGTCNCFGLYYGDRCECSSTDIKELQSHLDKCRVDNTSLVCSGNGDCICGECFCTQRPNPAEKIDGNYCECHNYTCDRAENRLICGGPERGTCVCGNCECEPKWSGSDCSCTLSTDPCKGASGKVCSGNGRCECGKCICNKDNSTEAIFEGNLCNECPSCDAKCNEYRPCVECQIWQMGDYSQEQCEEKCGLNMTKASALTEENTRLCKFQDANGCLFQFTYSFYARISGDIQVLDDKKCVAQANFLTIALAVFGSVFLLGFLILLIVKLGLMIKDRRDYAKFLEEVNRTSWGNEQNPLYKAAVSKYTNPTYGAAKGL